MCCKIAREKYEEAGHKLKAHTYCGLEKMKTLKYEAGNVNIMISIHLFAV